MHNVAKRYVSNYCFCFLGAGIEGPMTTHTSDCSSCDFRINKVPAKDWPKGSKRPLYVYRGEYPATVSKNRGSTWDPGNLEGTAEQLEAWGSESPVTGYIPQVEHTYALYESGYGIMNGTLYNYIFVISIFNMYFIYYSFTHIYICIYIEHQVAIGESTCAAIYWAAPTIAGGKAMIEARELTRIALERCKTAREAVLLMGELAVTYVFYAAG